MEDTGGFLLLPPTPPSSHSDRWVKGGIVAVCTWAHLWLSNLPLSCLQYCRLRPHTTMTLLCSTLSPSLHLLASSPSDHRAAWRGVKHQKLNNQLLLAGYPRRRNVATPMVELKQQQQQQQQQQPKKQQQQKNENGHIRKNLTQHGEPQRNSWERRRRSLLGVSVSIVTSSIFFQNIFALFFCLCKGTKIPEDGPGPVAVPVLVGWGRQRLLLYTSWNFLLRNKGRISRGQQYCVTDFVCELSLKFGSPGKQIDPPITAERVKGRTHYEEVTQAQTATAVSFVNVHRLDNMQSVSQGWICQDHLNCCETEVQVAVQVCYLTRSEYTDTGPTSLSTGPITHGMRQGSHKAQIVSMTWTVAICGSPASPLNYRGSTQSESELKEKNRMKK